ncbi:hypothetical protein THAOC_13474 [Thalassiosira oceanica]|uniref:Uncharacterized protein n=1 Tax=Thalassiosira oceanica TaxID=159749 RepID=K0SXE2_THAOC|nr:hypothetical protein THAOC_13474 [Thalassiosira oceanica]|mmetsp:Transcript_21073/g.49475  ORF Transcript_21073/g.49475 Transcript_21073/m.49475 type:complete len:281 (+) Transcript_21073:282-1124(+)|eukprot:EJK65646.1 hypothetical protein THAOC_13474 [Thalassiosira oceanica]
MKPGQNNAETTPLLGTIEDGDGRAKGTAESRPPRPLHPPPPPPSIDESSQSQGATTKSSKSKRRKKRQKSVQAKIKEQLQKRIEGPQRSICHVTFNLIRIVAVVANFMMLAQQLLPLVLLKEESTLLQNAVRAYMIIFCVSFIVLELRIPLLSRIAMPNSNWILKGFMYSFIGLIGMEQDLALKVEDIAAGTSSLLNPDYGTMIATLFLTLTTWIMIGIGAVYTLMGLLCMQSWYENMEKKHRERVREWKKKKKKERDDAKKKRDMEQQEERAGWFADEV